MIVGEKFSAIAIIVVAALMLATTLFLRRRIIAKEHTIERFDESERLSKALESNISEYEARLNTLRNALAILKEDGVKSHPAPRAPAVRKVRMATPNPKRKVSDLNTYERSLGANWLNVKNNDMDNTHQVRKLLKELGLPESRNDDDEKAQYENYCTLRKATKQCVVGRKDCVDHCNPPDSVSKIWG